MRRRRGGCFAIYCANIPIPLIINPPSTLLPFCPDCFISGCEVGVVNSGGRICQGEPEGEGRDVRINAMCTPRSRMVADEVRFGDRLEASCAISRSPISSGCVLKGPPKKSRSGNEYFYFCLTAAGVEESTRKSISFASRVGRGLLLLLHRWCSAVPRMLVLGSWVIFL